MVNNINREGYFVNEYRYKDFTTLNEKEKEMVLEWRNTESVRKWMYNKEVIDLESHLRFIKGLSQRDDRYYWLVFDNQNNPVGTLNVTNVDRNSDRAELGLYMNPASETMGYFFVRECYNFFFNVLDINHLYCSVAPDNTSAMLLDQFFGCVFSKEKYVEDGGVKELYLVSDNLTKEVFNGKNNRSFRDYITFVKQNNQKRIN